MSNNENQQELAVAQEPAVADASPDPVQPTLAGEYVPPETATETESVAETEMAPPAVLPVQLPGATLAARREEMRLSIDEVSSRLKLAPRQIVALESDDFSQLPGLATVRGFIRSYAKLLELQPEPLIAALVAERDPAVDAVIARRPLPSPGFSGRRYSPSVRHRSAARRLTGLAAVIVLFVGTLGLIAYRNDWLQMPAIDLDIARSVLASSPAGATPGTAETAKPVENAEAAMPAATAAAPSTASALQLSAHQDSWVEVIAVDGERKLVSKLMKAGTTELVEITEPVVLVVGNAAGIGAVLRGQSLNLRAAARDNVAKLSLK